MTKQKAFEIALELNKIAMSLDINTLNSLEPNFKKIEQLLCEADEALLEAQLAREKVKSGELNDCQPRPTKPSTGDVQILLVFFH